MEAVVLTKILAFSSAAIFFTTAVASDGATAQPKVVKVFIRPDCQSMFYGPPGVASPTKRLSYISWDPAKAQPRAFKDPRTAISFYVESDGRHLAAIGPDGKILWVRNPFEDRHLCPYRSPRPVIVHMEVAEAAQHSNVIKLRGGDTTHEILSLQFDSSQFGVIDEITGDFFPEGQN
jgi:hypothetical protein